MAVEGNHQVGRKKIETAMDLPDQILGYSEDEWEAWTEESALSLSDLYRETGYLDAEFRLERLDSSKAAKEGRPAVALHIREGMRYKFGRVVVKSDGGGSGLVPPNDLKCRSERFYDQEFIFKDRRQLLNRFGDAGYLNVRVSEEIRPDTLAKEVHVTFRVDPQTAVVFDTLIIRNRREEDTTGMPGVTGEGTIRPLLDLTRGDTVSSARLNAFEKKLKSTRVFNYVRLKDSLLTGRSERSALILFSEERIPGELDASLFYETQYGPGVSAAWTHGNMFGHLHEGRLGGSLAQLRQSIYLGYASPLLFGTSVRFDNDLVANWYQDSKLQSRAGLYEGDFDITNTSKISRALAAWCRVVGSTELKGLEVRRQADELERDFSLNFINSVFFSFLDHPVNPSKGIRSSFTWGNGGPFLKQGEIQAPTIRRHNWLEVENAIYFPLHERLKIAFRLDGGRFFGAGDNNADRFFLGGPRSVRSFGWHRICPDRSDSTGVCRQEGLEPAYFLTSFEVRGSPFSSSYINPEGRLRHLLGVQVVPFVDYGNIWAVGKPLTRDGKGTAYGLGLRYALLSIFNLRVDYAVDGTGFEHSQWVLDLAQAF